MAFKECLIKPTKSSRRQHFKTNLSKNFVSRKSFFQKIMLIWWDLLSKSKLFSKMSSYFFKAAFSKAN